MGKRPKTHPLRHKKDQTACCVVTGLISMFDFRSTRKLLANKRHGVESSTHRAITSNTNEIREEITETEEITSVKKLMEEEMMNEHDILRNKRALNQRIRSSNKTFDEERFSEGVIVETIIKELCEIHQSDESISDIYTEEDLKLIEKKLCEAIEVFMIQSRDSRKDRKFMEALETINSYKDLFLEFIQDPSSRLVNHIKVLQDCLSKPENGDFDVEYEEEIVEVRPSSKIVILKPGPITCKFPRETEKHSPSSFTLMKRRLKNVMKKGHHDKKISTVENNGWSSPNRDHKYNERFAKSYFGSEGISGSSKDGEYELYNEAKRHISEMVSNEEGDNSNSNINTPERLKSSLGRLLDFEEYKDDENTPEDDTFVFERARLSLDRNSNFSPSRRSLDSSCIIEEIDNQEDQENLAVNNIREEINRRIEATTNQDEIIEIDDPENSITLNPNFNEIENNNNNLAVFEEESEMEYSVRLSDMTDRLSPVSVLGPIFSTPDINLASPFGRPVRRKRRNKAREALLLEEEEEREPIIYPGVFTPGDDDETPFDYVEALLLGSDLNWDNYLQKWLSSDKILDQELFNEVELFSNRPHDRMLMFDATNVVLKETCDRYFGGVKGANKKQSMSLVAPKGMDLINEVWIGVEKILRKVPCTSPEGVLKKDLIETEMWKNWDLDVNKLGVELESEIFEDLIDELVSCVLGNDE